VEEVNVGSDRYSVSGKEARGKRKKVLQVKGQRAIKKRSYNRGRVRSPGKTNMEGELGGRVCEGDGRQWSEAS